MERGCAGVGSGWAGAYRGCLRQWENRLKTGALRSRIRVFLRGKRWSWTSGLQERSLRTIERRRADGD